MTFKDRIRYFNRNFLNRLMGRLPSLPFGPFALVRHKGRKSGKPYATPIMVAPLADGFMIALTYGPKVDWYRNILAAGKCKLRWHGREITIDQVEPTGATEGRPPFSVFERTVLGIMGIDHYAKLTSAQ